MAICIFADGLDALADSGKLLGEDQAVEAQRQLLFCRYVAIACEVALFVEAVEERFRSNDRDGSLRDVVFLDVRTKV